jgi:triacylglycerol esterase/lipase EstA (alpha/beta hydrolase family)
MSQFFCRLFVLCFSLALGAGANAQQPDYDREARWASEIVPSLVVGDALYLDVDGKKVLSILTQGDRAKPAIVLVHGVGVHPDFGLIGQLRTRLNDAGYTTLSVQMPVLAKEVSNAAEYFKVFNFASPRIQIAGQYLTSQGYKKIILLSHSMGSWMSNVYLENAPQIPYAAWICLSITGKIGSTGMHSIPILDVQAENDLAPVLNGRWLRKVKLWGYPGSKQIEIEQADHHYSGQEAALTKQILQFLQ